MERYELVEGASSKFWEVEVSGMNLTVRFGRIGTAGQTKTKTFGDAAAAQKEWEKLVKEKTGKGYGLVNSGGTLALAAAKPAAPAGPAAKAPPAPAATAPATPTASPAPVAPALPTANPTPAPSADIAWPEGGFEWTPALRQELPALRGVHVPPPEQPYTPGQPVPAFASAAKWFRHDLLAAMALAVGATWSPWGQASKDHLTHEAFSRKDGNAWMELLAQVWCAELSQGYGQPRDSNEFGIQRAVHACCTLHGLPFALEVVLRLWAAQQGGQGTAYRSEEPLTTLRWAVAAAEPAAYEEALAAAGALKAQHSDWAPAFAFVFPHLADWCIEAAGAAPHEGHLLLATALPVADWIRYAKAQAWLHWGVVRPALLVQVAVHGEETLPAFAWALARAENRDTARETVTLLLRLKTPAIVGLLASGIDNAEVRDGLDKLAADYPAAVLQQTIQRSMSAGDRMLEGWTVRMALRAPGALQQALAGAEPTLRSRFEATLALLQRPEASPEQLPDVLRAPPWLGRARQGELPVLAVTPQPLPDRLEWDEAALREARGFEVEHRLRNMPKGERFPQDLGLTASGAERLLAGQPLQGGDVKIDNYYSRARPDLILASPQVAQLLLWNSFPPSSWALWAEPGPAVRAILARHGVAALPGLQRLIQAAPDKALPLAAGIDSPRLVETMARALRNLKKSRGVAEHWLRAHARTALSEALPQAFREGAASARDDARYAVRWLHAQGFDALAREVAAGYGAGMTAALDALLALDPLLALPARMPKLPAFFVPAAFRRPVLHSGGALPVAAAEHLGTMLAISKLDAPYAGLQLVRDACAPASLAEFAWDLFEAWLTAGAPSKEAWAFSALGLLGDDETARRLAPRIREWPGESAHARAVTGLDLLAAIGTDVALMHLNGIAGKVKFKALQERAKEKIAAVAEARGFTPEELADRLVPDLGLDESGTVVLDFGPRQFTIGFDEALKPFVRDAEGARLKDLPKAVKTDDAALAEAATERYKLMKKDAKAVASLQLIRLEMGMVARRRWSAADFQLFFVEHPLMRHLAARLVWGVYAEGRLTDGFRLAEDATLAGADDLRFELPADASVGICHVLELDAAMHAAFGQVFADYEIQQPFRQLDRETYTLTPDEQGQPTLKRFADKTVATGSVMGLINRGWERGQAQDAGWVGEFTRRLGEGLEVDVSLDPGTIVGDMSYEPRQRMPEVTLRKTGTYGNEGLVPFGQLDAILASEILRDLDLLAPLQE
ncbi:DUF4132 domain-containing protein [Ramlibacter sp. WS9]|uniref:DUF4132 domain-containing protein n=1 Tax=Ramlibacter sp. WS9 TaxID=1882741 RepID=UPI00114169C0|nr:DUF4132 domain-containing protein [Ramlibacter sp. WS9]ROZ74313.1 DUF4132 domain-containing protein [Ramlibacter sp. WS9]